jgi:serine/threonine protein kinase
MAHKKYTTTSDVWSFGILLWEIMAEGARPYDGMDNLKVVTEIDRGYVALLTAFCVDAWLDIGHAECCSPI